MPDRIARAPRGRALAIVAVLVAVGVSGCGHRTESVVPFTRASVSEAQPGVFTVSWDAPGAGRVTAYAGVDRDHVGRGRPVAGGDETQTSEVAALPAADRWWFELVPEHGRPLVLADRSLHLATAPNFRDLGGYRTYDGRWVPMGVLYRSDQLDRLSGPDAAKLDRLGIRTVVDLRTGAERAAGPDRMPAGARPVAADVLAGSGAPTDLKQLLAGPGDPAASMRDLERVLVRSPGARQAYRTLLSELARPDHLPLVFHCTAGKDRTGWAAATVLTVLGVPAGDVLNDYLDSNRYVLPEYASALASLPPAQLSRAHTLLEVRPDYLQAGLDEVAGDYGSMEGYAARALGIPAGTLRAELLDRS